MATCPRAGASSIRFARVRSRSSAGTSFIFATARTRSSGSRARRPRRATTSRPRSRRCRVRELESPEEEPPAPREVDEEPPSSSVRGRGPRSMPIRKWAPIDDAPQSFRAPRSRVKPRVLQSTPSWPNAIASAGAFAGALAVGVVLVGPSGDVVRLPLADRRVRVLARLRARRGRSRSSRVAPWTGALRRRRRVRGSRSSRGRRAPLRSARSRRSRARRPRRSSWRARSMLRAIEPRHGCARVRARVARRPREERPTGDTGESDVRAGEQVVVVGRRDRSRRWSRRIGRSRREPVARRGHGRDEARRRGRRRGRARHFGNAPRDGDVDT